MAGHSFFHIISIQTYSAIKCLFPFSFVVGRWHLTGLTEKKILSFAIAMSIYSQQRHLTRIIGMRIFSVCHCKSHALVYFWIDAIIIVSLSAHRSICVRDFLKYLPHALCMFNIALGLISTF